MFWPLSMSTWTLSTLRTLLPLSLVYTAATREWDWTKSLLPGLCRARLLSQLLPVQSVLYQQAVVVSSLLNSFPILRDKVRSRGGFGQKQFATRAPQHVSYDLWLMERDATAPSAPYPIPHAFNKVTPTQPFLFFSLDKRSAIALRLPILQAHLGSCTFFRRNFLNV